MVCCNSWRSTALLAVAGLLLTASPGAAGAQNAGCPGRGAPASELSDEERAPKPNRPVSDDTAATLAAIRAMGPGVGRAGDPQSQALLSQMAALLADEDDADSQAAAAMLREQMGGSPGPVPPQASGTVAECAE